jgi:hypothetical protein
MTHLTPDELIDAMEAEADNGNAVGLLAADRRAHLAACDVCRREVDALSATLGDAKQASVPEPSPLFWNHFSERVRVAIDEAPSAAWPTWMRWQVLAPLGAVALIILGLMISVPKQDRSSFTEEMVAADSPATDDTWVMVENLVGEIDLDTASAAGVIEPGVAEQAVLQLTAEEQRELTRLLKAELQRAKS